MLNSCSPTGRHDFYFHTFGVEVGVMILLLTRGKLQHIAVVNTCEIS